MRRTSILPMPMMPDIEVALFTGGQDPHYALGLTMALAAKGICLDVIGGDIVDGPEMHCTSGVRFFNLHGSNKPASIICKAYRVFVTYFRIFRYAATAKPKVFHILWNNKLLSFDRTFLMIYFKLLGKRIVLTAHNVNADRRDSKDSLLNRLTLEFQYRLATHIFVHTNKMKDELVHCFHVKQASVSIIPYGINNAVPHTNLTSYEAKQRLGLLANARTILFFGSIKPYKGLEYLITAFQKLSATSSDYRLIIAGECKKGGEDYFSSIQQLLSRDASRQHIIQLIGFVPDDQTELYFKASDVIVLPYTEIFQSGIAFLAYSFGLPIIATDVGSFADDIVSGKTGFVCRPKDSDDLTKSILRYFNSDLYSELDKRRQHIIDYTQSHHSWDIVADITKCVYQHI